MDDTSPEAQAVMIEAYRNMSPWEKAALMGRIWASAKAMHREGYLLRNPGASDEDVQRSWIETNLPPDLVAEIRKHRPDAI